MSLVHPDPECNYSRGPIFEEVWAWVVGEGMRRKERAQAANSVGHPGQRPAVLAETRRMKAAPTHRCSLLSVKLETQESTRTSRITKQGLPLDPSLPLRSCRSKKKNKHGRNFSHLSWLSRLSPGWSPPRFETWWPQSAQNPSADEGRENFEIQRVAYRLD